MSEKESVCQEYMTWNEKRVEEVRRVRNENAEKFNYDISEICADIRKKQAESKRKIVTSISKKKAEKETPDILQTA